MPLVLNPDYPADKNGKQTLSSSIFTTGPLNFLLATFFLFVFNRNIYIIF